MDPVGLYAVFVNVYGSILEDPGGGFVWHWCHRLCHVFLLPAEMLERRNALRRGGATDGGCWRSRGAVEADRLGRFGLFPGLPVQEMLQGGTVVWEDVEGLWHVWPHGDESSWGACALEGRLRVGPEETFVMVRIRFGEQGQHRE
jgi:hypothetical protein